MDTRTYIETLRPTAPALPRQGLSELCLLVLNAALEAAHACADPAAGRALLAHARRLEAALAEGDAALAEVGPTLQALRLLTGALRGH